jgi:hypothetical protein
VFWAPEGADGVVNAILNETVRIVRIHDRIRTVLPMYNLQELIIFSDKALNDQKSLRFVDIPVAIIDNSPTQLVSLTRWIFSDLLQFSVLQAH